MTMIAMTDPSDNEAIAITVRHVEILPRVTKVKASDADDTGVEWTKTQTR
jgi:hypothetical protein